MYFFPKKRGEKSFSYIFRRLKCSANENIRNKADMGESLVLY